MKKLRETLKEIQPIDGNIARKTQARLDKLTKPQGSLGRLEELAIQLSAITGNESPLINSKTIFVMAGDHGITEEGVSAFPKEVTPQMVYNFINGGAGINVLARHAGARVVIVDMGVASNLDINKSKNKNFLSKKIALGTKNFTQGPAMTKEEAIKSLESGIEVLESESINGIDIMGTGDMGIGNTTPSSAITAVITGSPAEDVTGRGTGINDKTLAIKHDVIKRGISINNPDPDDALDVLSKVGGFEIGGLAGLILAAASKKIPVVIDGFISGAAALLAYKLEPKIKGYLIAAHSSVEKGHKILLDHIGLEPLLSLNLRLGEGTGAALGINLVEASIKVLNEMATFESAKVSEEK